MEKRGKQRIQIEMKMYRAKINVCIEDVKKCAGGSILAWSSSGSDILSNVKCCQRAVGGMLWPLLVGVMVWPNTIDGTIWRNDNPLLQHNAVTYLYMCVCVCVRACVSVCKSTHTVCQCVYVCAWGLLTFWHICSGQQHSDAIAGVVRLTSALKVKQAMLQQILSRLRRS